MEIPTFYVQKYSGLTEEQLLLKIYQLELQLSKTKHDVKVADIDSLLLENPTGASVADLSQARALITNVNGITLESDITACKDLLGGADDLHSNISDIITDVEPDSTNLTTSISTIKAKVGGTSSIKADLGSYMTSLDGVSNSLNDISSRYETLAGNTGSNDDTDSYKKLIHMLHDLAGNSATNYADSVVNLKNRIGENNNCYDLIGDFGGTKLVDLLSSNSSTVKMAMDFVMLRLLGEKIYGSNSNSLNSRLTGIFNKCDLGLADVNYLPSMQKTPSSGSTPAVYFPRLKVTSWSINAGMRLTVQEIDINNNNVGNQIDFADTNTKNATLNDTIIFENNTQAQYIKFTYRGSDITSQSTCDLLLSYFSTMYPVNSYLSNNINDVIANNILLCIGGSGTTIKERLYNLDLKLADISSGVLNTDLATCRTRVTQARGTTLESELKGIQSKINGDTSGSIDTSIESINSSLNGTSTGSQINTRIATIQDKIKPYLEFTGAVSNWPNMVGSSTTFSSATNIDSELAAFLALFDRNNWNSANTNAGFRKVTFDLSTPPTTLKGLLEKVYSVSS